MPWNARPKLDAAIKAAKKLKGPVVVAKLDPPGGGGSAGRSGEGWIRPKHFPIQRRPTVNFPGRRSQ
jgi:hypothetical protein